MLLRTYCDYYTIPCLPSTQLGFEFGVSPRTDDPFGFPIVYEDVLLVSTSASSQTIRLFGSAILGECFVRWWLRSDERFQSGTRLIQECRVEGRATLGGSESCLPSGERAYYEERKGEETNNVMRRWREGEEKSSEGHASAQSLVRSQTNRRPAHVGLYVSTLLRNNRSFVPHLDTFVPHPSRRVLLTRVSAATSMLTQQASHPSTTVPAGCLSLGWGTVPRTRGREREREHPHVSELNTSPHLPRPRRKCRSSTSLRATSYRQHPIAVPHYVTVDPHYGR